MLLVEVALSDSSAVLAGTSVFCWWSALKLEHQGRSGYVYSNPDDLSVTACKDYIWRRQRHNNLLARCATFVGSTHSTFLSVPLVYHRPPPVLSTLFHCCL